MSNLSHINQNWLYAGTQHDFVQSTGLITSIEDPTYLGFVLTFDFVNSPLLSVKTSMFTIEDGERYYGITPCGAYLDYVSKQFSQDEYNGEYDESGYGDLNKKWWEFRSSLYMIQQQMPWFYQSVSGLDDVLSKYTSSVANEFTPYKGGETPITINCLESIDLKMNMIMQTYRELCFDRKWMRTIVPVSNRQFSCTITVFDIRKLKTIQRQQITEENRVKWYQRSQNRYEQVDIDNIAEFKFHFKRCIFLNNISTTFSEINMANSGDTATSSFAFTYGDVVIEHCANYAQSLFNGNDGATEPPLTKSEIRQQRRQQRKENREMKRMDREDRRFTEQLTSTKE